MSDYPLSFTVTAAALAATSLFLYGAFRSSRKSLALPPGPKPWFIYGNASDIPHKKPWIEFHKWSQKYGGLIYFTIFQTKFIVINDYNIAFELLDKRSHLYSDRPRSVMLDLLGWGFNMTFFNYGTRWKEHRRVMHQNLNNRAVREWRQTQQDAIRKFLKKLIINPDDWLYQIEHLTGSAIMKFTYGYDLKEKDEYMPVIKKAVEVLTTSQGIGFMVDKLPILKYVPSWFPGARFKRFAEEGRPYCEQILEEPFKNAKDLWLAGKAPNSYVTRLLDEFGGNEVPKDKEQVVKETSAVLYAAGTDSTYSIINSFFLASIIYPETVKKAREEIDRVVGLDRLPTFTERESLPYVDAMVKELFRWNPAAPLSPSHQILVDDVYNGYLIPAGTILHPNIWSMTHNEDVYPDPFNFKPERFLGLDPEKAKKIDPRNMIFGFGRRVCVGQFFADQQIWLTVACLIATFDIKKATDEFGREITPVPNYPGFVGKPDPFPCVVTVRDQNAVKLIEEATTES